MNDTSESRTFRVVISWTQSVKHNSDNRL